MARLGSVVLVFAGMVLGAFATAQQAGAALFYDLVEVDNGVVTNNVLGNIRFTDTSNGSGAIDAFSYSGLSIATWDQNTDPGALGAAVFTIDDGVWQITQLVFTLIDDTNMADPTTLEVVGPFGGFFTFVETLASAPTSPVGRVIAAVPVHAVPVPAAVVLLGSGLVSLFSVAAWRRKRERIAAAGHGLLPWRRRAAG